ncbi:MAG TPA: tetratricopeptide repeat protein [Planctomycetota bacterium]
MELRPLAALLAALTVAEGPAAQGKTPAPTFSEHVAPILHRRCLPCHRSGEAAPFALVEHAEVAKRARQILTVTRSRYMPPWLPSPGHGEFVGERRLTDEELDTLARWVEAGTPEGDPARLPPLPPVAEGWQLGPPDLVVTMAEPFTVPAEGLDVWRTFVLPIPAERTRFVEAVELRPGNKRVVHHAVMKVDRTASSRELDAADAAPGFEGMDMGQSESPGGQFLGWTPGKVPQRSPAGLAWTLEPGTDLVLQLHMVPSGKPEPVQVAVAFHFTEQPPTRKQTVLRLRQDELDIPAGASDYLVEDALVLPAPIVVTMIYPHAHYLGKRLEAFAELPDGGRTDLILIEDWDFNWQDEYRYATPVRLPAGARLRMRYTFDNSAANPRNPRVPPQPVRFGNRSLDEMATLTLQVLTESGAARRALMEAVCRQRVEQYPGAWTARLNLGAILAEQGQFEEAATHLRAGLALAPEAVDLHMNLGGVLASLGRLDEAQRSFEEALRLSPRNPGVHSGLAQLEGLRGRWEAALEHYRIVLASSPHDAQAQRGLGSVLLRLQRPAEAAAALERALELGPTPETHAELARAYAALGREAEAAEQREEARRLAPPRR